MGSDQANIIRNELGTLADDVVVQGSRVSEWCHILYSASKTETERIFNECFGKCKKKCHNVIIIWKHTTKTMKYLEDKENVDFGFGGYFGWFPYEINIYLEDKNVPDLIRPTGEWKRD